MSGICYKCKRESCHIRFDGCKTCDLYERGETRHEKLFGTPERAARTLFDICDECEDSTCRGCKIYPLVDHACDYDALLEWLRSDDE